ncbi:MAG: DUF3015 family protein [Pseudomonadota bacterium]
MKKVITLAASAAATLTLLSGSAFAQSKDIGDIYTDCGLGGAIFPDAEDPIGPVLVNILISSPTVLTQGLLVPGSCSGGAGVSARMMHAAYPQFEMETAVGEGEYLTALMDVMECDASIRASLIDDMRDHLGTTVADPAYASMEQADKAREMYVDMYTTVAAKYPGQCAPIE